MQSAERLADDLAGLVQNRMPIGNGNRQLGALTHERPYEPHLRGLEPLEGQLGAVACTPLAQVARFVGKPTESSPGYE